MSKTKITGLALVVVAIIAISAYLIGLTVGDEQIELAGNPGPEYLNTQYLYGGAVYGADCFATSTTGTLTAGMFEKNGCIRIVAAGAGQATLSLTLPASTTMASVLPKVGVCRDWWIDAGAVAAATTTTIVAGTGINIVGLDATGAGTGADVIDGAEFGTLKMCKQANGDVAAFIEEWIAAD